MARKTHACLQGSKFLDGTGLDYRRYAEPLFDIIIAGGLLGIYGNRRIMSLPLAQSLEAASVKATS